MNQANKSIPATGSVTRQWRMKPRQRVIQASLVLASVFAVQAQAQTYPDQPIRLIWPYSAGTGGDSAWRALCDAASKVLGQTVVLENRPGSAARNGINALKSAAKDGYTVAGATTGELVIQSVAAAHLKIDPLVDYQPVSLMMESNLVLTTNPAAPFRDIKGMIDYAKANPGKLNGGHGGFGASTHIALAMLIAAARIDVVMVPFKGAGPANTAVLGNVVQLGFNSAGVKPQVDSGKLIALVTAGNSRWKMFPNTPTMVEAGIPATSVLWHGLIAPAGTPAPIVARLQAAFATATKTQPVIDQLEKNLGLDIVGSSVDEFTARIRADLAALGPVIRKLDLKF